MLSLQSKAFHKVGTVFPYDSQQATEPAAPTTADIRLGLVQHNQGSEFIKTKMPRQR